MINKTNAKQVVFSLLLSLSSLGAFSQNVFNTTGNAIVGGNNHLSVGYRIYLQFTSNAANGYTRGSLSQGITWDNSQALWNVNATSNNSDFSLVNFENLGRIVFYSRASTGSSYTMTNAELGNYRRMTILNNGNVGIGTYTPAVKLAVNGDTHILGNQSSYTEIASNVNGQYLRQYANNGTSQSWLIRGYALNGVQAVFNNGGIDVNGRVRAKEVKVEAAPWPDYVFEEGYELPDLSELSNYIKQHKHLPGMPSAKEVESDGIALGEMNRLLLEKVEELTLHLIEKERTIESHGQEIVQLKQRFSAIDRRLLLLEGTQQLKP